MQLDPFAFRDMFLGARSMAVVGNASSVLAWSNGKAIDAHDLVVRFNRAHTAGLEDRIGSRTDILVTHCHNKLTRAPSPAETLKPRCVLCFLSPAAAAEVDPAALHAWVGDVPMMTVFGPDPIGLATRTRTRPLTMGTYALYTLPRLLMIERLFVTGFTMFGAVPGDPRKYFESRRYRVGDFHDLDAEAEILRTIVDAFPGELTVTPEVRTLLSLRGESTAHLPGVRLRHRVAGRVAWSVITLGLRLRRLAESSRPPSV